MIIKEIRCDVCNDLLVDSDKCFVYKSFTKMRLYLKRYHICDDCKKEIIEKVKERKSDK